LKPGLASGQNSDSEQLLGTAEQACQQHIVTAAATASSAHTPSLCRCHLTFLLTTAIRIVLSQTLLFQMNFPSGTYKIKYDSNATNWAPSAINVLRPSSPTAAASTVSFAQHCVSGERLL
jgi:hypothetical protein